MRMMHNYFCIGEEAANLPHGWLDKYLDFCDYFLTGVAEYQKLIMQNPIFLERVEGIGIVSAINWGLWGPMLRASRVRWDLRKVDHYKCYDEFDWGVQWQKERGFVSSLFSPNWWNDGIRKNYSTGFGRDSRRTLWKFRNSYPCGLHDHVITRYASSLILKTPFFFTVTTSFFNITYLFTRSSYLATLSFNCFWIPCIISLYFVAISLSFFSHSKFCINMVVTGRCWVLTSYCASWEVLLLEKKISFGFNHKAMIKVTRNIWSVRVWVRDWLYKGKTHHPQFILSKVSYIIIWLFF